MNVRNKISALAIFGVISCALSHQAFGQNQSSGPMFSTPASRSTTGAPILSEPSSDSNGIIGSAGGGSGSPPAQARPQAQSNPQPAAAPRSEDSQTFGNWELQCETSQGSEKLCQVSGKTTSADMTQVILVMSIAKASQGADLLYQAALPLGIAVQRDVAISVADKYKGDISVSRCTPQGCIVEGTAETALIDAMKDGADAQFTVVTPEGRAIPITLSLEGFSAALSAMLVE